jgi:hypothetical protein
MAFTMEIRHGIFQINMEEEAASGDINAASEFLSQLQNVTEKGGYFDEQLYSCDETVLYYELKEDAHRIRFKLNKYRLTLLLCTNKAGSHRLTPLCTGKSRSPRCFNV